nr:MAG TPA: hypothetical protein [Caudoviricetes sp.]DAY60293.1 MAG TPA: hypothetical protein [Caudoviricetes sp.]
MRLACQKIIKVIISKEEIHLQLVKIKSLIVFLPHQSLLSMIAPYLCQEVRL